MCGISGIFTKDLVEGATIYESLKSIQHRGPDNSIVGAYKNQQFKFLSCPISGDFTKDKYPDCREILSDNWIGFNRLSIIDLSSNGDQPFYDLSTQTAFMLNGEVYNFLELKENELKGENFFSSTDSEVAFKLYLKYGDDFVYRLRGMFAITIVDYRTHKVKIWRDPMGIKPMYYFIDKNQFIFSSEMNGIFKTKKVQKEINPKNLAHIFYLHSNFAPNTLYKSIQIIEPGQKIEVNFKNFEIKKEKYWTLNYQPQHNEISKEELINDLDKITSISSIADVKQALMLSGGLDSGILAHFLKKHNPGMEAITIYNENTEHVNELFFAEKTALLNKIQLSSFEIPDSVDLKTLYEYAVTEEEPSGSIEPAYYISKRAHKEGFKVLYSALGLDELFYGYKFYSQIKKWAPYQNLFSNHFKIALTGKKRWKYDEMTSLGLFALPMITRSAMSWNEIKSLFGNNDWEHPVESFLESVPSSFYDMPILKQMSWLDLNFYIGSYHTFRSDQPSMKNSIEMRFPFLDHLFIQKYFNQVYTDRNLTHTNNKPYIRKNLGHLLDKDVLTMPKKGFTMPKEKWMESLPDLNQYSELFENLFGSKFSPNDWANSSTKKWFLFSTSELLKNEN